MPNKWGGGRRSMFLPPLASGRSYYKERNISDRKPSKKFWYKEDLITINNFNQPRLGTSELVTSSVVQFGKSQGDRKTSLRGNLVVREKETEREEEETGKEESGREEGNLVIIPNTTTPKWNFSSKKYFPRRKGECKS